MFRSDEEAAVHRADALQRELDAARNENELLQRQLANAMARITAVETAGSLQRELDPLADELASARGLLEASENERRRLESLIPPRRAPRTHNPNPGNPGVRPLAPIWVMGGALALLVYFLLSGLRS
jgi:hypothetical protein